MASTLTTSGARRGCGLRQAGAAYIAVPLGPHGRPVEHFLVDPPQVVRKDALGLAAVGVTLIERAGVTHVLDIVGRDSYPTVSGFVEEVRRLGVSRRVPKNIDFSRLTSESRLVLLHEHADIANALEFPPAAMQRCPCEREDHLAEDFRDMCARLWWDEPMEAAAHRLAIFGVFPVVQIEVVRDSVRGRHREVVERAGDAGVPVIEVDQ